MTKKNVEQAKFTGKKFQDKIYYRHTGHPGGIKETTPENWNGKNLLGLVLMEVRTNLGKSTKII